MMSAKLPKNGENDIRKQDAIRNIMLRSLTDDLKYQHKDGVNYVQVTLVKSKHAFLFQTLGAMLLAIVVGFILSAIAPASFNSSLNINLLSPIKTMYLNALKMVAAPVVFFSIVSCIVRFPDLSALGRIGVKILSLYLCTTFIAVGEGILLSMIVSIVVLSMGAPGIPGSGLFCLSVLLTQMNVPVEAIGLVMGIDPLIGMFRCMSNCLGDVVVTSIVAKSEDQMNMEIYRQ